MGLPGLNQVRVGSFGPPSSGSNHLMARKPKIRSSQSFPVFSRNQRRKRSEINRRKQTLGFERLEERRLLAVGILDGGGNGNLWASSENSVGDLSGSPALIQAVSPSGQNSAKFGTSVDADGSYYLVGAPGYYANTGVYDEPTDYGRAYLYNSSTGQLVRTFENPSPGNSDQMGWSVALSGSTVVLGAVLDSVGSTQAGRAMLFNASSGSLIAAIDNPTPASNDSFGYAVSASGSLVAISAIRDRVSGVNSSGTVYIYNTSGALQRTLRSPNPTVFSESFGNSISLDGTTLAVGTGAGYGWGQVYIYNATTGALLRTFDNPGGSSQDRFGDAVALSGNKVAIGAYGALSNGVRTGVVRIYDINTGVLLQTYTAPSGVVNDGFGYRVDFDGSRLAVGAPFTDVSGVTDVGASYLYDVATQNLLGVMGNPAPNATDQFGNGVALTGSKILIGAPQDDTVSSNQGSAYVFSTEATYDVSLSNASLQENSSIGTVVGSLSAAAPSTAPVTFALVSPGTDNSSFTIVGSQLKTAANFDYETKSSYSILVEAIDANGLRGRKTFSVTVSNINEGPSDIFLSNQSIAEIQPAQSLVGNLSAIDPDLNDTLSFSLTNNPASDNSLFEISGSQLVSHQPFDFESGNEYQVEVRAQDSAGLAMTKAFTIAVTNVNTPINGAMPRYDLRIVADLNSTIQDSSPQYATEMNGYVYFSATTLSTGRELYRTHQATGQTEIVADLVLGMGDSNPQSLVVMNDSLYFTASYSYLDPMAPPGGPPDIRFGIWKSDGTNAGTVLMKVIQTPSILSSNPRPGFVVNGKALLFIGSEGDGEQLWSTTGTSSETTLLKSFNPSSGMTQSMPSVTAGGLLYFNREVDTNQGSHSLWRTDGTVAGTIELRRQANVAFSDPMNPFDPRLAAVGSTVYFSSFDMTAGFELWKTDGTVGSTQRVSDINAGPNNASPNGMTVFNNAVYYSADDGIHGRELWKTTGTISTLVKDIDQSLGGLGTDNAQLTVFNGLLYFVASDGSGLKLWRTDGSGAGTSIFTSDGTTAFIPDRLIALSNRLLIANTYYGSLANQLWSTDGSLVSNELAATGISLAYSSVVVAAGRAFFGRSDTANGTELWVSDGLSTGTQLVSDIRPGNASGFGGFIGSGASGVMFLANDGTHGIELGISNGTPAGTQVIDVARGTPASNITEVTSIGDAVYIATMQGLYVVPSTGATPILLSTKQASRLTPVGSKLFFTADDSAKGNELWVSDGTAAGTKLVYDIRTGTAGSNPELLTSFGGLVYFVANDGTSGKELWRSGGVANDPLNTQLYHEFVSGSGNGNIQQMQVVGSQLYLLAGGNLYVVDNTNVFTLLATNASSLMPWNNIVYFSGYTAATGYELWRTDGTTAGTYLVKDIVPGPDSSYPGGGVVANEDPAASRLASTEARLVFRASDASGASQLFATNGTTSGTSALTSAPVVEAGSGFGLVPFNLKAIGNQVYFQGYSQTAGLELWTSDGTVSGTHIVSDLRPGVDPDPLNNTPGYPFLGSFSNLKEMTAFRNKLFFSADTVAEGRELWVSDGSASGSYLANDIRQGSASGSPKRLLALGNALYLAADTDEYGAGTLGSGELFRLNEAPYLTSQADTIAIGGSTQFRLDGFDNDGDSLIYQVATQPAHGILSVSGNVAIYTASAGYVGDDSFSITAFDGTLYSDPADFKLSIQSSVAAISFVSGVSFLSESSQVFVADVALSIPATEHLAVPYAYGFGKTESQGIVTFAPGQSTSQIIIPITNDVWHTSTLQQIEVTLKRNSQVALGTITQRVESILDDDPVPTIFFVDSSRTYSEADGTVSFDVALSNPSDQTVTANITLNGSANEAVYSYSNPITFLPGQVVRRVLVHLIDDSNPEPRKHIAAQISSVSGATVTSDPDRFRSIAYINDNDTSVITLSPGVKVVSEGEQLVLTATRQGGNLNNVLDIPLVKVFGDAVGGDYSLSQNNFHFAAGTTQSTIQVSIADDSIVEGYERLVLGLVSSPNYALGDTNWCDIGIFDNDSNYVTLEFDLRNQAGQEDPTILESTYGQGNRVVNVVARLSQPSSLTINVPVLVNNADLNGYAKLGADFTFSTADFVFAPGVTVVTRQLTILDDSVSEPDEKLTVSLAPTDFFLRKDGNRSDAGLTKSLLIRDNDYTVSVTGPKTVSESDNQVQFTVSLNKPPTTGKVVDLQLNTSMERSEFQAVGFDSRLSRSLIFNAGDPQSKTVTIQLIDDTVFDGPDELMLSAAVNSGQGSVSSKVEITDNESPPALRAVGSGFSLSDNSGSMFVEFAVATPVVSRLNLPIVFSGSAKQDVDFRVIGNGGNGFVTIDRGSTVTSIQILPLDNRIVDGDKILDVTILPTQAGSLAISIPPSGVTSSATISETSRPPAAEANPGPVFVSTGALAIGTGALAIGSEGLGTSSLAPASGSVVSVFVNTLGQPIVAGPLAISLGSNYGIIEGGQVFFDANFNGLPDFLDLNENGRQDEGEPLEPVSTSDLDGMAKLEIGRVFDRDRDGSLGVLEGRFVSLGGLDTSINLPRRFAMYAPSGVYSATTISTLVENLIRRHSYDLAGGIAAAGDSLRLGDVDVAAGESIYQVLAGDSDVADSYSKQVQIFSLVSTVAALFGGSSGEDVQLIADQVYDYLSDRVADGGILELTSDVLISQLLSVINQQRTTPLSNSDISTLAQTISAGVGRIQSIKLSNYPDPLTFLQAMTRAKKVIVNEMADDFKLVGSGVLDANTAQNNYAGANFDSRVSAQIIGQVIPTIIGVSDAIVREGNSGTQNLTFTVDILGDHDGAVTVTYLTVDGTAESTSDYSPTSGTLTWPAHDLTSRIITVPISGDSIFEMDEYLSLVLSSATNAVLRRPQGLGYILNDDALTVAQPVSSGTFEVIQGIEEMAIVVQGNLVGRGFLIDPLSATFNGNATTSNQFRFDFSSNSYRADVYTATGGAANDTISLKAGRFHSITHLIGADSGTTLLRAENNLMPMINWSSIETFSYLSSVLEEMIVQVPESIVEVVIDDPDPSSDGVMRISSPTNQFAPILFATPISKITIVKSNPVTTISTLSVDATFSGTVDSVSRDVSLSTNHVAENAASGTVIGIFQTQNPILEDGFEVTLVPGAGDTDNASFSIVNNELRSSTAFDHEAKGILSIHARITDTYGSYFDQTLTVLVTNVNELPTDIALSNTSVAENLPIGTTIGNFTSSDPDIGDTFTYTLVAGPGSADNASFTIVGDQLRTTAVFDFETKSSYTIRVRSTDAGGLSFEKQLSVSVSNQSPHATGLYVRGSSWNTNYLSMLAANDLGSAFGGFRLVGGTAQLVNASAVTWQTINQISASFNEPVIVSPLALRVFNSANVEMLLSPTGFSYDTATNTAKWTVAVPLSRDKFLISLDASLISDTATVAAALDGEWITSTTTYATSGNGSPGGDLNFRFNYLPGDMTRNGQTNAGDANLLRSLGTLIPNAANYWRDPTGNNQINSGDANYVASLGTLSLSGNPEPNNPPAPRPTLRVATSASSRSVAPKLNAATLQPIVKAAIDIWAASGISTEQLSKLRSIPISISDLGSSGYLGLTALHGIVIDDDAGKWGWYVDTSPRSDSEFVATNVASQGQAIAGSLADNRIDLLTVILHELGHELGFAHDGDSAAPTVMAETLPAGIRRKPKFTANNYASAPPTTVSNPTSVSHLRSTAWAANADAVFGQVEGNIRANPLSANQLMRELDSQRQTSPLSESRTVGQSTSQLRDSEEKPNLITGQSLRAKSRNAR